MKSIIGVILIVCVIVGIYVGSYFYTKRNGDPLTYNLRYEILVRKTVNEVLDERGCLCGGAK